MTTSSYVIRTPLIQTMIAEHVHILRALDVLKAATERLKKRQDVSTADLRYLIRFFREYADRIHHYSEEEILFTAIENSRNRDLRRMIEKLGTQHVINRILIGQMSDALKGALRNRRGWRAQFVENAVAYHALLSVHICDEDHLFFPLADKTLRRRPLRAAIPLQDILESKVRHEKRIARMTGRYGIPAV